MPGKLSAPQRDLLERVCLKAYTARLFHYMGNHRPNEYVRVTREVRLTDEQRNDQSLGLAAQLSGVRQHTEVHFRPATAEALRRAGLIRYDNDKTGGTSTLRPTRAGMQLFCELTGREVPESFR